MLAIEKSKTHKGRCTPNVLPCRINHNGPVDTSKRYWNPMKMPNGKTVAYFRGKKLHGQKLRVPEGYRGVVISSTDRILPRNTTQEGAEDDEDMEPEPEVKVAEEQSEFEDVMVWGHEAVPDTTTDPYIRGMEEWIGFSQQIHSYETEKEKEAPK